MRRWIAVILAVASLLAIVDIVAWQVLTRQMRTAWSSFVARHRADGWQVAAGEPVAEGFPLAARLRIADVEISHDSKPIAAGMSAGAQTLLMELPLLWPTHIAFIPQGLLHLRLGSGPDIDFTAQSLALRGALGGGAFDLNGAGLQAATLLGPVVIGTAEAHLALHSRQEPPGGALQLTLKQIGLPQQSRIVALGQSVNMLAFDVTVDAGRMTLQSLNLDWGKLSASGRGSLQTDAQGQPAGDVKLQVFGASETLDALTTSGDVAQRDAGNAKMVLGLLQRTGPDGRVFVDLPLKLANRVLSIGGFPVMRMPELHLPALQSAQ